MVTHGMSQHDCLTRDEWARLLVERDELPPEALAHAARRQPCAAVVSETSEMLEVAADYQAFRSSPTSVLPSAALGRVARLAEAEFVRQNDLDGFSSSLSRSRQVASRIGHWCRQRPAAAALCAAVSIALMAAPFVLPKLTSQGAATVDAANPQNDQADSHKADGSAEVPARGPVHEAFAEIDPPNRAPQSAYWKSYDTAFSLAEKGELDEAILNYRKAVRIDPTRPEALAALRDLLKRVAQDDLRAAQQLLAQGSDRPSQGTADKDHHQVSGIRRGGGGGTLARQADKLVESRSRRQGTLRWGTFRRHRLSGRESGPAERERRRAIRGL